MSLKIGHVKQTREQKEGKKKTEERKPMWIIGNHAAMNNIKLIADLKMLTVVPPKLTGFERETPFFIMLC